MALLIFGKFVPADCIDVEHRGWGICRVSYRYSRGDGFRVARRQIYHRDGELKMLCLTKWPGFHLVAWQTPSDMDTYPGTSEAASINLKNVKNEIESTNDACTITWLPHDEIVTHQFHNGVFVLLPLTHSQQINGSDVRVNAFAVAVRFQGSDRWRGLNLRVGLNGSPEDEAREILSRI